jgi:membrane protein implicated in regulation of membrane protease activity
MAAPRRRDRTRPLELIGLSAVLAGFAFLVVLMGSRNALLALEFAGAAFIVALVVLAMLALAAKPDEEERHDLEEQDRGGDVPPSGFH